MNVSPLRYPGGKTRACKKLDEIMKEYFDMSQFDQVVSPFFGGGSFEFYLHHQYQLKVIANDKFQPLYQFWKICKNDSQEMGNELVQWLNKVDKEVFLDMRKNILDETNPFHQACMYFIINRCRTIKAITKLVLILLPSFIFEYHCYSNTRVLQ